MDFFRPSKKKRISIDAPWTSAKRSDFHGLLESFRARRHVGLFLVCPRSSLVPDSRTLEIDKLDTSFACWCILGVDFAEFRRPCFLEEPSLKHMVVIPLVLIVAL